MIRIAEAKIKSPWDGKLTDKSMRQLIKQAISEGDWISVHTEKPWGGSLDCIRMAKDLTDKPILAKGIHEYDLDVLKAFRAGANFVLCVGRVCDFYDDGIIYEPSCLAEIPKLYSPYHRLMWNRRDLSTGEAKKEPWDVARKQHLGWLGCASYGDPFPSNADACLFSVR